MNTLQRSSYSFRRQGSSGRIWDNRIQIPEMKTASKHDKDSREFNYHPISNSNTDIGNASACGSRVVHPSSGSRSETKSQRCALISIFGCCLGSPAS
ncbi:hypothetical protein CDL12_22018 [Handroanthus impetiginosus]|uniref:Uncharacterized protein n=1 Tax=Handroanthus impetiginosus TaxID=429701 RepID=A0A2G9GK83_9LAMI|nr:hypothetical protein CDL12_22018 [Handroanthus impetiginosus]